MLNFFYDSLDTLKWVKKPTRSEVTKLTIQIFIVVAIMSIFFLVTDTVLWYLYNLIYELIK